MHLKFYLYFAFCLSSSQNVWTLSSIQIHYNETMGRARWSISGNTYGKEGLSLCFNSLRNWVLVFPNSEVESEVTWAFASQETYLLPCSVFFSPISQDHSTGCISCYPCSPQWPGSCQQTCQLVHAMCETQYFFALLTYLLFFLSPLMGTNHSTLI